MNELMSLAEILKKTIEESKSFLPDLGLKFISTIGGKILLPHGITGEYIECIGLEYRLVNNYYKGVYNPNAPSKPDCVAIGRDEKAMVPLESSRNPQHTDCPSCPHNQWNSNGKGRRCKNTIRLTLIPPDATSPKDVHILAIPPASLKNFHIYVSELANARLWLPNVLTRISLDRDVAYTKFTFENRGPHARDIESLNAMYHRGCELAAAEFGVQDN